MTTTTKTFELRLPVDLHQQLKVAAAIGHVSMNSFICEAIKHLIIDNLEIELKKEN
jgi:predicted HicB family RNase H-like nuclease